jgi:hypothetical protein
MLPEACASEGLTCMTTIQIEATVSMEQLLRAVDRLPPQELEALLVYLFTRLRGATDAASSPVVDDDMRRSSERQVANEDNPYLAVAGLFADDAFAAEVSAYIEAQRQREREAAACEADA